MKTLYVRIVLTFIVVTAVSSVAGLLFTNSYYKNNLLSQNEQRTMKTALAVKELYEHTSGIDLPNYLTKMATLGYQFYLVNDRHEARAFGSPFKQGVLSSAQYDLVMDGEFYQGMNDDNDGLAVFAFFVNSLRNTAGVPIETPEGRAALFVRPDLQQQIGEVRFIMAAFIGGSFVSSLLLIVVLSRYIVNPVKKLTKATGQIANGDYEVQLDSERKDEIGELARRFASMAASIRRSEESRQQFVANVSHEFQTPLTSIQGLATAAADPSVSREESVGYMRIIASETVRLSSLSQQLLTLAFLDQAKQLEYAPFRLDEQLRQIIIMLEWQWSEKQLELELDLPETMISGDAQLLYQVWTNLITNSIKFSKAMGTLSIAIKPASEQIDIVIRDTGEGIPEADLPYLFERFYKADQSRAASGSGLGLSIAHKIVTLHDGNIAVQSQYGQGAVFTVKLPAPRL
ncbi:sensor histidine kinase [Paenibacillus radicis (ex Gao et al. 2016)]|uniref:Heme sensor protein HssS n=1 Tax=Paenibacillus radicis (ex Gao et al. 2016) TaxID=1737354 RepID=A0A917HUD5_9BACL|nr:HAMP domain-containing sensor histidine kinase [Paenibacillus radicis (ex Gao et al. 2016)]GGG91014.1 two-component sensor histidine kinase [Paenibacillus radicis (ex Gao et al. 2016)]